MICCLFDFQPLRSNQVSFQRTSPLSAALLNSTFIQGFELDDWHSEAPLHSNAIVLPALFAAAEHAKALHASSKSSGIDFLLAYIIGCEVGPRVGLALHGERMLTLGWHSGAVFGPSASATAVCKLLKLPANLIEDAVGIACTQACGLMSAQFESEVKRMQHGFAARNGLLAALLARKGYVGIKQIYERPYGGFLATFSLGSGREPAYLVEEISKELSSKWLIEGMRVKPYAAMAGTHCTVDCVRALQEKYPDQMKDLKSVYSIKIEIGGEAAFHHGGWKPERPLTSTGAQMSNAYVAAAQLIDGQILPPQFRDDKLDREEVWDLVNKTHCVYNDGMKSKWAQAVTIMFKDGKCKLSQRVEAPKGKSPALSNAEILDKWRSLTMDVVEKERIEEIESLVLKLENCKDIASLGDLMAGMVKNPIA